MAETSFLGVYNQDMSTVFILVLFSSLGENVAIQFYMIERDTQMKCKPVLVLLFFRYLSNTSLMYGRRARSKVAGNSTVIQLVNTNFP